MFNRNADFNMCYNCTKRHLGCHSTCAEYKSFREKRDEFNRTRTAEHNNFSVPSKTTTYGQALQKHRTKLKD